MTEHNRHRVLPLAETAGQPVRLGTVRTTARGSADNERSMRACGWNVIERVKQRYQ